jgi:hypothetical protein
MKRGRLRRQYSDLTERELNLKLLEEIDPPGKPAVGLDLVLQPLPVR